MGDIVIILDASGSIVERNWFIEKQLAIDVIKGLKVSFNDTHVGVISYSATVDTILVGDTRRAGVRREGEIEREGETERDRETQRERGASERERK